MTPAGEMVEAEARAEHVLKCWPMYFDAVKSGRKNFEVRRDDRGFQKGDVLVLQRWHPEHGYSWEMKPGGQYRDTQRVEVRRRITYILTGAQFGIEAGCVVMGLEPA